MKLPGFSAEAALYEAKGVYRTVGTEAALAGPVLPQQMESTPSVLDPCNWACACCYFWRLDSCCEDCDNCQPIWALSAGQRVLRA
jgi:hypothetical protein